MSQEIQHFNDINYRLLEEFNDTDNNTVNVVEKEDVYSENLDNIALDNDSLYESAKETHKITMNIENLNNEKVNLTRKQPSFTNTTVYKRKDSENHDNKFVDPDTLNSYLTISDLHDNTRDNVNILRSNLQKLDERENRFDEMQTKTEYLMSGADKFKRKSKFLKNKMLWVHVFNWLLVVFFIFLIVFLITKLR